MNASSSRPGPIEAEFKLVLADEEQRRRVLETLLRPGARPDRAVQQENHFFDTASQVLRRARCVLRARREDGNWTLTLKGPPISSDPTSPSAAVGSPGDGDALARRAEEERVLSPTRGEALVADPADALEPFLARSPDSALARHVATLIAGDRLVHLGSFSNERTRLAAGDLVPELGVGIELDRTRFPGQPAELELEVELGADDDAGRVERALRSLLDRARVPWVPATGKAARFFRILDRAEESGTKPRK